MKILITGGTGFIGRPLVSRLLAQGHELTLWVRNKARAEQLFRHRHTGALTFVEEITQVPGPLDAVVNLAGEGIIDRPWTQRRKQVLMAGRVDVTRGLVQWIAQQVQKPTYFLSGSAIGIYGNYPEDVQLDEQAALRDCFASRLCQAWEFEARKAQALSVGVGLLRTGVVLHPEGGALKKLWLPFKLGLGGRIGSGRQWLSWIHLDDMVEIIVFALNKQITGPINATAPQPVAYNTFTQALASCLHRPHFFPVPELVLKTLLGEAAQLLVEGQKVIPATLTQHQFAFQYSNITAALKSFASA